MVLSKLSVSSSAWGVVGAYTWTIFNWYMSVKRGTSSDTLEVPEDTLVMLSFHFLFARKHTPACPLLATKLDSRWPLWRVVKRSYFRLTSPSPITSHSTPVCSLGWPEPPPRSQTYMLLWGLEGLALCVHCMLVFMAYPFTLANAGWKEVPKLEYET